MSVNLLNMFSSIRARRLRDALERYEANPGLEETVRVVQLLMKTRDYNQAFMYADNGYQRFPSSRELLGLRQSAMKRLALEECRELQVRIAECPKPEAIAKMIEIRRSLNNFRACEKIARKWADRFSESWILQFAIAKYLFQRSLVEKDPRVSSRCLSQLEHAVSLRPDNYKTLLYLATLLHQLGKRSQALATVEKLLSHFPNDPRALSLITYINGSGPAPATVPSTGARGADPAEIFETLRQSEAVHALVHQSGDDDSPELRSHFAPTSALNLERGEEIFTTLVHSLKNSAQRMGIGTLTECSLEGGSWNIFYLAHPGGSFVLCADKEMKPDKVAEIRQKLVPATESAEA